MTSRDPLVSIVTSSYNQAQFLEQTILSVLNQDYPNIEYIIIDGGSTDGSTDIIRKYEHRLAYWISEPDRGQADAINKGWSMAKGEVAAYLNSDDTYLPHAVSKAVEALMADRDVALIQGDGYVMGHGGVTLHRFIGRKVDFASLLQTNWIFQPSVFFRRQVLDKVGMLDVKLHMAMDYDLWLRIARCSKLKYIPVALSCYRLNDDSKSKSFARVQERLAEHLRVLGRVFDDPTLPEDFRRLRNRAYANAYFRAGAFCCVRGRRSEALELLARSVRYDANPFQAKAIMILLYFLELSLGIRIGTMVTNLRPMQRLRSAFRRWGGDPVVGKLAE